MDGLDKFREAFAEYSDNYVVIGGAACDITMTNTVVRPRATHDIDMIVIVENMTEAFANRFWQFVREAGYRPEKRKQEAGEPPIKWVKLQLASGATLFLRNTTVLDLSLLLNKMIG